jgi:hypothetical protein
MCLVHNVKKIVKKVLDGTLCLGSMKRLCGYTGRKVRL